MHFKSTRNENETVDFAHVILDCMPSDGGLYVPCDILDLRRWILYVNENTTFTSIAGTLTSAFIGDEFSPIISETISERAFSFSPAVKQLDNNVFLMELFHGPTGWHRDFGIAYLVSCLETILQLQEKSTLLFGVTTGGLGTVLARVLKNCKRVKAVLLYPKGQVRGLEKKDCIENGGQILPLEFDGDEKDCHAVAERILSDEKFVSDNALTVANTINIGRLLPQTFFYPFAFSRVKEKISGDIYFALAPGNYSNVVAGLYSWKFSLPLSGFFLPATNKLTVDAMGNTVMVDDLVPMKDRPRCNTSDPSNIERLAEVFSANSIMMRNFLFPAEIGDASIETAAKELFKKYGIYADRHTSRAYAAFKAQKGRFDEYVDAVVLIARDNPAFSADFIQQSIGETPNFSKPITRAESSQETKSVQVRSEADIRQAIANVRHYQK